MKRISIGLFSVVLIFISCNEKREGTQVAAEEVLHQNQRNLTDIIIYDIFSPPVASRIYVYTSLAAYEAVRYINPAEESITAKLNGFPEMPQPVKNKEYNYVLAASKAFYDVMRQITFSKDTVVKYEEQTYSPFRKVLKKEVYDSSIAFGEAIAKKIMQRANADNYKQTRPMEKFYGSKEDGKWRPTSPDYLDGTEPYWNKLKPLTLDSASQFDPGPPPMFSKETSGAFYKMNKEVYDTGRNLTSEQKDIARFWDDNPFVTEHSGHLMAATKKQTPGGHWMGIAAIACRQTKADVVQSAKTYALTAVALFEAFISVFDTKYRYVYIRPITAINDMIDPKWEPYLQTPPFPEYTSGHSTITGCAATILTNLYGHNFAFNDTSNRRYINMERSFRSFIQASDECSISRFYGGIHYRISVDKGAEAGKKIGAYIIDKLKLKK